MKDSVIGDIGPMYDAFFLPSAADLANYWQKRTSNRYTNKHPPNDLCIKHQEWRQFTPQGTDSPQSKFINV